MKKKQKKRRLNWVRVWFVLLLMPVAVVLTTLVIIAFATVNGTGFKTAFEKAPEQLFNPSVPEEYIPLYQEAGEAYGVPWTLLAAHHRIETKFSTMDPMLSPVGAEGPLQFMPCTFVGWSHPTCSGLGEGDIKESEKTDPAVIEKYGGYGVDGNGDGIADPYNLADALYSAANYLARNGAANGELERAIFNYNHSEKYVTDVLYYYEKYEQQFK